MQPILQHRATPTRRRSHLQRSFARQFLAAVAFTALVALSLLSDGATAAPHIPLATEPNVPFPVRVYALSLPTGRAPSRIRVTENGRRVDASLVPIRGKTTPYSAVVLLDASLTMNGRPFVAARTAARTLIANKPARSELALYGFAAQPFAVQNFSKSKGQLAALVRSLRIRYGTAVWNTVILASQKLRSRQGSAKAIVILTDGRADTTKTRVAQAIAAAKNAGARVFVVVAGPGGPQQRARLNHLAGATGGFVVTVDSVPRLRAAFARLARTLSHQFILSYSSRLTKPGRTVRVTIRVDNATGAVSYVRPPSADAAGTEDRAPVHGRRWRGARSRRYLDPDSSACLVRLPRTEERRHLPTERGAGFSGLGARHLPTGTVVVRASSGCVASSAMLRSSSSARSHWQAAAVTESQRPCRRRSGRRRRPQRSDGSSPTRRTHRHSSSASHPSPSPLNGWEAEISVENRSAVAWKIVDPHHEAELAFGVMLFATDDVNELERRNRDLDLPAIRAATRYQPALPVVLEPGNAWHGVISAPGALAGGLWVRVAFGPFSSVGEAPKGTVSPVQWFTDHAYHLAAVAALQPSAP